MPGGVKEPGEMERLLAEVQRTIRDNDQFIRYLKEEVAGTDGAEAEQEADSGDEADHGDYEEL